MLLAARAIRRYLRIARQLTARTDLSAAASAAGCCAASIPQFMRLATRASPPWYCGRSKAGIGAFGWPARVCIRCYRAAGGELSVSREPDR